MMVRVNSSVFTWFSIWAMNAAVLGFGLEGYHRIRHTNLYWENRKYSPEIRSARHGPPICESWCVVTFNNGLYLEQRYDCCKFREKRGYCPSKTICTWPLPYFLTTIYQCFHDFHCPRGYKCCEDSCFVHSVCHPKRLQLDASTATEEPATEIATQTTHVTTDTSINTEQTHITTDNSLDTSDTPFVETSLNTEQTPIITDNAIDTSNTPFMVTTETVSSENEDTTISVTTGNEKGTQNTASMPAEHELTDTTTTTIEETSTHVSLPEQETPSSITTGVTGDETELGSTNIEESITQAESTYPAVSTNEPTTSSITGVTQSTVYQSNTSTNTRTTHMAATTTTRSNVTQTYSSATEYGQIFNSTETGTKSVTYETTTTKPFTTSSPYTIVDNEGSGSGDYYEVPQPENARSIRLLHPSYGDYDDEDLDGVEIV